MDRLALFRRAFNRQGDVAMAPEEDFQKVHNSRKALRNWRVVLDKVATLCELIGRENLVNSWLPQDAAAVTYSPPSSMQFSQAVIQGDLWSDFGAK